MFRSATVKLTTWYLVILMSISIIFSVVIYGIASHEVRDRLTVLQQNIEDQNDTSQMLFVPDISFSHLRKTQADTAAEHLGVSLLYANMAILLIGGAGAYFLARRTLDPLQKAHEGQSRFVSYASHELRTPLAAMKMELEVALREKTISDTDARSVLSSSLEEVEKLTRLSTVLLQLSKAEREDITLKAVDLVSVAGKITARYEKSSKRLKVTLPQKHIQVHANKTSLEDIVAILIDNALKYSPEKSTVSVRVQHSGKYGEFIISNLGDGIAPDRLPHIFDYFYQASPSRSDRQSEGFGLGLSLAKQLTDLHAGSITAVSGIGQKTTFTLRIPIEPLQKNKKNTKSIF